MAVRTHMDRSMPRRIVGAEDAVLSVLSAADRLQQAFAEICERHGLTPDQYGVLRILREAHPTGQPRGEVMKRCIHRAPDMTRMLDRLVRQGLARRMRAPADRRCSVATITKAGLALLARMQPAIDAEMQRRTQSLTRPQLQQLAQLTEALVD